MSEPIVEFPYINRTSLLTPVSFTIGEGKNLGPSSSGTFHMLLGILPTIRFYYKTIKKISNKLMALETQQPNKPTDNNFYLDKICRLYPRHKRQYWLDTFQICLCKLAKFL